jgi:hypothetical protein
VLAIAVSQSGCVVVAPLATVALVETYENAIGRRLDPTPPPAPVDMTQTATRLDAQGSPIPGGSVDPAAVASPDAGASAVPVDDGSVTMNMYNQIQNGMTYAQVVAVFKREGQLMPARSTVIYVWYNPNGSLVRVIFSGQLVADKVQERLS